jgi:hypothetical protein
VVEYWDGGPLKVFRGIVTMRPDDPSKSTENLPWLTSSTWTRMTQPKLPAGSELSDRSRFNLPEPERAFFVAPDVPMGAS